MINIVHDNLPHSNVWFAQKRYDNSFSIKHKRPLPKFFHLHDLNFFNSADGLDSFIYPVCMHEPYIQARSLISNHNDFGFWSHVSDDVIKGLREKRGWIIIDLAYEPIVKNDFDCIINSLADCSMFPNDRVLINTTFSNLADNKRVFCFPSYLELGCYVREFEGETEERLSPCPCRCGPASGVEYPHRRLLLLNSFIDFRAAKIFAKYASANPNSFLNSSSKVISEQGDSNPVTDASNFLRLPDALYATDINLVIEAYADNDVVEFPFITEKTYRNIKYKKPFITVGQQYTLASLHKLGYKTFHPIIDEHYDNIYATSDRIKAVIKEVTKLILLSDRDFNNLLNQCRPILEHNYNNLMSRINQTNDWLEGLKHL